MCWRRLSGFALQSHEELRVTRDVQSRNATCFVGRQTWIWLERWNIKGVEVGQSVLLHLSVCVLL